MPSYRFILILLATTLLVGCGVKFFYRNLDFFIPWYVDDFVELNDIQEDFLEKTISKHQRWHRNEQLPQYVKLIDEVLADFEKNTAKIDEAYILKLSEKIRGSYQQLSQKVLPDVVTLLIGLSEEQIEEIFSALAEVNEEFVSDNTELSDQEYHENRIEKLSKSTRRWIGKLTKSQLAIIESWVKKNQRTDKLRHQFHLNWQKQFKTALLQKDPEKQRKSLMTLMTFGERRYPKKLDNLFEENKANGVKHLAQLVSTLSERQRRRIAEKIRDLRNDLATLAAEK